MRSLRAALLAAGVVAAFPLTAAAHGDDDTPHTTDLWGSGPAQDPGPIDALPQGDSTDPATGEDLADACAQWVEVSALLSGTGDPENAGAVLEAFAADPPSRLTDAAPQIAAGLQAAFTGDPAAFGDPAFVGALGMAGGYLFELCALDARLDVEGADYLFTGIPDVVKAGRVGIRLVNASMNGEPHELIVVRRPDGDTRTVADVAALDPETLFGEYAMVGVVWAEVPSSTMSVTVELEAGEYLALCTLPIGEEGELLHIHGGMIQEFSVR